MGSTQEIVLMRGCEAIYGLGHVPGGGCHFNNALDYLFSVLSDPCFPLPSLSYLTRTLAGPL
jgi:hypothetical protein